MAVSLFSMLSMGSSALQTQQILLDIAGQNVANAATRGYTRQRGDVVQNFEIRSGGLLFGMGSRVATIERVRESLIDSRFRRENSVLGEYSVRMDFLSQIEDILNEPSQEGIAQALTNYFDSLQELTSNPEDMGVRTTVLGSGVALADSFNSTYELLDNQRTTMNEFISSTVDEVNRIVAEISDLNRQIGSTEMGSSTANASRDSRDRLLDDLSELVSVQIRNNANGTVNVYLDGYALVQDFTYNTLAVQVNPALDPVRKDLYEVVAADADNRPLNIEGGNLGGYLDIRDGVITDPVLSDLNALALTIIEEVNRVHSQGVGLTRYTTTTSNFAVTDAGAPLDAAGLPFTPQDGSFFLAVYGSQGQLLEQHEITVDADTDTLNSIVAKINAAFATDGRLTATVTADNQLTIQTTTPGDTFTFVSDDTQAGDTSDFLLAMGLNAFFTFDPQLGPAASIAVSPNIMADVGLIAAARSTSVGDNSNALALAQLRNARVLGINGDATMEEFFQSTLVSLGFITRQAIDRHDIQQGVVDGITNLRDSISGVSLDEEAVNIMTAQQAYQASATFTAAVNDVIDILFAELG